MAEEKVVKKFVFGEKVKDAGNPGFLVKTNQNGEPVPIYSEEEIRSMFAGKDKKLAPLFSGEGKLFSIVNLEIEIKF